ncbi:MAG: alpha/beta hydrolase [Clostridiales bacterium]|nr:alpha/beta hydrolase [Clostridiales bacterium]MCF8022302.1 alpha/beta hydrolase [Clostridiales bacterium]
MANRKWEKVYFYNSYQQKIAGLFYTADKPGIPLIIVCHGFTGSKEGHGTAVNMSEYLAKTGFDILLFDFAGNGESEGNFEDITLSGQIDDLTSAVNWCKQQGTSTIITFGRSFGGSTVICHAAKDTRVSGVCTWAAPAHLVELFSNFKVEDQDVSDKVTLAGSSGTVQMKKTFFEDLKKYDIPGATAAISPRPLLLLQGTADNVVPPENTGLIYENSNQPKRIIYIEEDDHQFSNYYRKAWEYCSSWLKDFNF